MVSSPLERAPIQVLRVPVPTGTNLFPQGDRHESVTLNLALTASAALLGVLNRFPVLAAGPLRQYLGRSFPARPATHAHDEDDGRNGDPRVREEFMHHAEMMFAKMDRNSDGVIDEDRVAGRTPRITKRRKA